jgi:phosphoglycerate kinase
MNLRSITEAGDLTGKYVIIRASFNVPLDGGEVRNAFRLNRALPTLTYLKEAGARTIVVAHIGREPGETLRPVFSALSRSLPQLIWGGVITDEAFKATRDAMHDGDIVVCENLRQDAREEVNDPEFVRAMAQYAEIYVNDAFAEAHRNHASTLGLAENLPAYAGLTLIEEVTELEKVMHPNQPALFLLGGAKFETKMPLVEKYLELYDFVFIGGALTNDVLKARGYEVGQSLVSDMSLVGSPFLWSEKLLVPIDVVVDGPRGVATLPVDQVSPDEKILDCGPETVAMLERYINEAATILWNGPFGNYEAGFYEATELTAELIAHSNAFSVIGGGDTVAAIEKLGLNDKFGFVSIGGGSMLTLLEHGTTPVLEALSKE